MRKFFNSIVYIWTGVTLSLIFKISIMQGINVFEAPFFPWAMGLIAIILWLIYFILPKASQLKDIKEISPYAAKCLYFSILSVIIFPLSIFAILNGIKGYYEIKKGEYSGLCQIFSGIALSIIGILFGIVIIFMIINNS